MPAQSITNTQYHRFSSRTQDTGTAALRAKRAAKAAEIARVMALRLQAELEAARIAKMRLNHQQRAAAGAATTASTGSKDRRSGIRAAAGGFCRWPACCGPSCCARSVSPVAHPYQSLQPPPEVNLQVDNHPIASPPPHSVDEMSQTV